MPSRMPKTVLTFKSVCMGSTYLDRAGAFSCVPSLPGWWHGQALLARGNLAQFFALTDKLALRP
ncbi:MAG: hypothetical protein H6Q52_1304 [Deltaproteobacteria bacterium]|nr:hypothetical protein [Deltaproteobacteria bacterium]